MQKGDLNMMRYVNHIKNQSQISYGELTAQKWSNELPDTLKHGQSARGPLQKSYTLLAGERR